ncbi:MAG: glycosyltransferase [Planctomycetaceae bacterium]|nr:glycosyltransferase [Planctomycetaceae bacterium]
MTSDYRPMFSVIMPVYNHRPFVGEAIQSVRDQTFGDWELIVIDDGSTDGSGGVIDVYAAADARVRAVHQANGGQAAARNAGIDLARGQWVAYLDSDDVLLTQTLEHYAAYIQEHPQAQFIYGYRNRMNADGTVEELPLPEYQLRVTDARDLFEKTFLSQLCVCYRLDLLRKVGGFDPRLFCAEDYDLNLRLSLHTKFEPIGKLTGVRRRHTTNVSAQTGPTRMLEAGVLKRWVEKHGGRDLLAPEVIANRLAKLYYSAGRQYFKSRCMAQAVVAFQHAHQYRRTFKSVTLMAMAVLLRPIGKHDPKLIPALD